MCKITYKQFLLIKVLKLPGTKIKKNECVLFQEKICIFASAARLRIVLFREKGVQLPPWLALIK